MSRSVLDIESEIAAIKTANPQWLTDSAVKALITALTTEKNAAAGKYSVRLTLLRKYV
jgi:hypothetical protein